MELQSIDDVISELDKIILDSEKKHDALGYFAVLYQRVTVKVKEGIENDYFDDGPRMEQLDIVFAKRYIDAYHSHQQKGNITESWNEAFVLSKNYWAVVLQHLLIGINAHINLDLGIAAADICREKKIADLLDDFNKINEILASLVGEVQNNLSAIWPALKWILKLSGKIDDLLVDFSMKLARDGAWRFAESISLIEFDNWQEHILTRDKKVALKAALITKPGPFIRFVFFFVRLGEMGSVAEKINKLKYIEPDKELLKKIRGIR